MEVGSLFCSHPPLPTSRTTLHSRNCSVAVFREQAPLAVASTPSTSIAWHFPASVLLQESRDDFRSSLHSIIEDKPSQGNKILHQTTCPHSTEHCRVVERNILHLLKDTSSLLFNMKATLDRTPRENGSSTIEEKNCEADQYLKDFKRQLLYWPGFWYLLLFPSMKEKSLLSLPMKTTIPQTNPVKQNSSDPVMPQNVLALAKKAVLASKEAASLAETSNSLIDDLGETHFPSLGPEEFAMQIPVEERTAVRSGRHWVRQFKRRRALKTAMDVVHDVSCLRVLDQKKKVNHKGFDPNDPLRLFLRGPETTQLLTDKDELDLYPQIQDLLKLEEVKQRLQTQFDREPTLVEWAQAVGMSCRALKSCIYSGNKSREKMVLANFRLVVHVAKQYQGRGLSIQDLLQEGSMGLMKSVEKFKPKAGCRFSTYAYWWIRQAIRKAIFRNSRTIRLPENVYAILTQIRNVRKLYIQEGHIPTNEELAKRVGITVEKLEYLLLSARHPISIQQPAWVDQDVTIQEITADPEVEIPDYSVTKQLMRRHVRNLLSILTPKERVIIRSRYGLLGGECNSLSEIGAMLGLSKERIRQVESRALDKLKQSSESQGLEAYANLLI